MRRSCLVACDCSVDRVDVWLLRHARGLGAGALVQVDRFLVPQEGAALALLRFQFRLLRLEFFQELGDLGLVQGHGNK
jgi:hypothetical protein